MLEDLALPPTSQRIVFGNATVYWIDSLVSHVPTCSTAIRYNAKEKSVIMMYVLCSKSIPKHVESSIST